MHLVVVVVVALVVVVDDVVMSEVAEKNEFNLKFTFLVSHPRKILLSNYELI